MASATTATGRPARDAAAPRISLWRTPRTRALLVVGTLSAVAGLVAVAAHVYTDVLWFRELGQEPVLWTTLAWNVVTPAFVGLGATCLMLANLAVVERRIGGGPQPGRRAAAQLWRARRLAFPLAAVAGGLLSLELRPAGLPRLLLLWVHRSDFGTEDPLFHRDVGFFVFSLPLQEQVARWLAETLLIAAALTLAAYAVAGAVRAARAHLLVLAALLLGVVAWRFRLEQFALVLPHGGSPVPGASYTDVHVRLPALRALMVLALAGAALCVYGATRRARLVPMAVVAALGLAAAALANGLPAVIERFDVEPQALARERPYVEDAIAATRRAYALDRVDVRTRAGGATLSAREAAANRATIENVPLWDSGVLRPAMNELQSIGGYYSFPSATVDRYTVDGEPRLMTVAARQLDLARLRREARTWANERFAYTHGYGVVAVQGGQTDADGYPRFAQREFRSPDNPLRLTQPRIYFGERSAAEAPYVVLAGGRGEVERPVPGSQAPGYHYDGPAGIPVAGLLRRAAFAARFDDLKLLLTETVTARSRIVLHRDVGRRLRTLAPFISWESHPQTVVAGGRVRFLFHGYTSSRHYPYAAPVGGVNYLRGAAVADVDAFSGQVSVYGDSGDPILRAWRGAYPTLIRPMSSMPAELRAHLRYPRRLFAAQTEVYATFHADDATGYWNGADTWQQASQLAGPVEDAGEIHFPDPREHLDADERREDDVAAERWRSRPGYLLARLGAAEPERLLLATSFTPRGRQNLVGYLAGWVDPGGRPRLTLLSLPRDRLTTGPTQATRGVLASPEVVARLQLLNRESRDLGRNSVNRTVLGVPRVVPLGDALVHVQTIYVTAGGSGLPRLQLVTAFANGRVGYGRDLAAALRRLLREPGPAP